MSLGLNNGEHPPAKLADVEAPPEAPSGPVGRFPWRCVTWQLPFLVGTCICRRSVPQLQQNRVFVTTLSLHGEAADEPMLYLNRADAAILRPTGGQRALNCARWFLLSESFQYAAQLMVGIFPISFLIFIRYPVSLHARSRCAPTPAVRMCLLPPARVVSEAHEPCRPLYYQRVCLSATLYVVNMLMISQDATRGGRLVGAVVLLGPAWVAIVFAGLLVGTLCARAVPVVQPVRFSVGAKRVGTQLQTLSSGSLSLPRCQHSGHCTGVRSAEKSCALLRS